MQNEPQLSAEMEIVTKFRQFLADWDYVHLTRKVPVEESRKMCDEFALTLATALEEQKQGYVREVELRKKIEPWIADPNRESLKIEMTTYNQALNDVLAILNGKDI